MEPVEEIFSDPEEPSDFLTRGNYFISSYKWYIFSGLIVIAIFWTRIQKYFDRLYDKYESRRYAAKYHKNPDLALQRLEELQLARQRMQEELDRKAIEHEEKRKERERQKALERIAKAEGKETGNKLGNGSSSENSFRTEYNPLMGDTSRGYRPPRRSGCPGGGCG